MEFASKKDDKVRRQKLAIQTRFKNKHVGRVNQMKNGAFVTIIEYRNNSDIDVQFENGLVRNHVKCQSFNEGDLIYPMQFTQKDGYTEVTNSNTYPPSIFTIDTEDINLLGGVYWSLNSSGYVYHWKKGFLHRILTQVKESQFVDHIDGNPTNNRKNNLRTCTQQQNQRNKRKSRNNTSGYKGVVWNKTKQAWDARIYVNKKAIYVGRSKDIRQAAKLYNTAAEKYFGEFAKVNEIAEVI